jgi:protein-tyrosine phosphatase
MIDIHCHILPLTDDGAASWEIAGQMCDLAIADGITHIVATPHANSRYRYDRALHAQQLTILAEKSKGRLRFSLGCDFHLSYENLELLFANPSAFVIGDTNYLLIEPSEYGLPPAFEQLLFRLKTELRITPILTHPERYAMLQRSPEKIASWTEVGCLVQITANSLTGDWGRRAKDMAVWLLQKKLVHIVATDAHDIKHRPPRLSVARDFIAAKIGAETATALVETNPRIVVENGPAASLFWAPAR